MSKSRTLILTLNITGLYIAGYSSDNIPIYQQYQITTDMSYETSRFIPNHILNEIASIQGKAVYNEIAPDYAKPAQITTHWNFAHY